MMRAALIMAAAFGCLTLMASAQSPPPIPEKKTEPGKSKDSDTGKSKSKEPSKVKAGEKTGEAGKEPARPKLTLEKMSLPSGTIVVVVDELLKAMELVPKLIVMTPEDYQALQEQIRSLQRQIKSEKKLPSFCKLQGRLEGNYLALRADFAFTTEQPKTTVFLGMLGAHLMDEGELDRQMPILDTTDEGFFVRVEKEGNHQLTLHLRVRVDVKKSTAGGTEQGIELGLPGAAVTTLHLDLPNNIKELRWNDNLEKTKTAGRWQLGLEKSKTLNLAWKEPVAMTGNSPLAKVEGLINVRIDESHININAELFLEDMRFQTKEWHLLLPPQAKVEAKPPTGLTLEQIEPDAKIPYHTLRLQEATAERWQVSVLLRVPRPNPGVSFLLGPFLVLGAYQQQGTIHVQMPTEASLGQRLIYLRQGDIYQLKSTETEATFQYIVPANTEQIPKASALLRAPLELQWRYEKNQLETKVEHALKIRTVPHGWEIDTTTRIQVDAIFSRINAVDLKLPTPRPRVMPLLAGAVPCIGYPAALPWSGFLNPSSLPWVDLSAEDTVVLDELGNPLKLVPQDALGKTRVIWERSPTKQITLVLKNLVHVPAQHRRLRLELPRPINTQDRGARISVQSDDRIELLQGPSGVEDPVPDKHRLESSWDQTPATIDLAWRPYQREIVVQSTADVQIFEHTAQVTQSIRFSHDFAAKDQPEIKQMQMLFQVPRPIDKVKILFGGEIIGQNLTNSTMWLRPRVNKGEKIELVLQYDLALLPDRVAGSQAAGSQTGAVQGMIHPLLNVPLIWPAHVSRKEVKVRIWAQKGGMKIRMSDELVSRGRWKERSIEVVPGKDQFPVLVLQGVDVQIPLALRLEDSTASALAAFLADRGLIQIFMKEDDSQHCRARFLLRKLNAGYVEVELPVRLGLLRDRPTFALGKYQLNDWKTVDAAEKTVRLKLNPELLMLPAILEIAYTLPAEAMERNSPWQTVLHPPLFRSEVVIEHLRWQVGLPTALLPASLNRQMRVESLWSLQGWLMTPRPAVTSVELEAWVTTPFPNQEPLFTRDSPHGSAPVTLAFASPSLQPTTIYHLERRWWLLSCSSVFLILALAIYLSPLPRTVLWLLFLGLCMVCLVSGMIWPALLPTLLFGAQPGLVMLLAFVALHWFWQERYRRQLVFLPAFTRTKPSSTLMRSSSVSKRPREASTVDAPAPTDGEKTTSSPPISPSGS